MSCSLLILLMVFLLFFFFSEEKKKEEDKEIRFLSGKKADRINNKKLETTKLKRKIRSKNIIVAIEQGK